MPNINTMIIEIEYYKGDTLLSGKQKTYPVFLRQISQIEADYDRLEDNFIALLCRRYGWEIIESQLSPTYVYDRDTQKTYQLKNKTIEPLAFLDVQTM